MKEKNILEKEKIQSQNRVWLRISSTCNSKCIFCLDSNEHDGTFISDKEIKKIIIKSFINGKDNRIIISGGEASINPKLVEYIRYAKEIGYNRVQTVTNGIRFSDEEFVKNVFEAGLEEVTFSIHGHNETLHDYLVGVPGAFKKVIKGLIYIKKYYPNIIVNIDIVVNKINVKYLPDIVKFFIRLGIYEFDILQIIPFGKSYPENKKILFYNYENYIEKLHETWSLSKIPGVYMWTNRFTIEAFEGYEDLIQDPRKIKGDVMGESYSIFSTFIESLGKVKPECFGDRCNYCFQKQFCNDFLNFNEKFQNKVGYKIRGEELISDVYSKYGNDKIDFINYINKLNKKPLNIPKCIGGNGEYEEYINMNPRFNLEDYLKKYINNLYRKKSLRCKECIEYKKCKGLHINFIRAYGFSILKPIKKLEY